MYTSLNTFTQPQASALYYDNPQKTVGVLRKTSKFAPASNSFKEHPDAIELSLDPNTNSFTTCLRAVLCTAGRESNTFWHI
ncbi:uncharacterized protein FOMMEDRAFT_136746 [Fomitiporia mediterranea MF3/22]|uniref:uncharacterized protein n=1 Tax=Fomitiporia mediterranea (strain MF3/22) TaxID=694068 RepID=UPI0004407E5E|nr:uncharacterized protein FOMMEDRAFT_136746 [Fomitiporia mediterranea MF3/22]EJC98952.1 hypothetical protein FOMMEDRAFT_136746 [Fomitiporia mediterranea MF3/22]